MKLQLVTRSVAGTVLLSGTLLLFGFGKIPQTAAQQAVVSDMDQVTATVETVDRQTRTILLSGPDGGLLTVQAGPQVRNLAQVKSGDRVVLRYREALAAEIVPASATMPPVQTSGQYTAALPGQKPAGTAARMVRARVTIVSVDADHSRVSFVGPARIERTVYVAAPAMQRLLRTLNPGDQVELTYTEAVAISVEPAVG